MLKIGDVVYVNTHENTRCTITSMCFSKSDEYTLSGETVNGRYVWKRETIVRYGLNDRHSIWQEKRLTFVGKREDIPPQLYKLGDTVNIREEEDTIYTVGAVHYKPNGYKYELFANGKPSRTVEEHLVVSAQPYTLF